MEALYFTPTGAIADSAVGDLPDLTLPVSYPQYASLALLPLQPPLYETQVNVQPILQCLHACFNAFHFK